MFASLIALLIAMSQWARWGGFIEWDLLSAASGLAQSAQLKLASLPSDGAASFNCPNLALDPQSPIFSDAQLKAVGHEICNTSTADAVSLRGTDGSFASAAQASARRASRQTRQRPAVVSEAVEKASAARGFTVANFEPGRTGNTREILDEVERSVRTLDAIDPVTPDSPRPDDNGDHDGSGKDDHHGDGDHSDDAKDDDDKDDDDKDDDGHDKDYSDNDGGHDNDDGDKDESHGGDDSGDDHDGSYEVAENDRDDGDHDGDSRDSDDRDGDNGDRDRSGGDDRDDDDSDRSGSNSGRH